MLRVLISIIHKTCDPTFNPMTAAYVLANHLIRTGRASKYLSKGGRVYTICHCTEKFTDCEMSHKAMHYSLC
jgi:hypothetical protein